MWPSGGKRSPPGGDRRGVEIGSTIMNRRGVARWLVLVVICLLATGAGAGGRLAADDAAPGVVATRPTMGATGVALDAALVVTFSEPVNVAGDVLWLTCGRSGDHTCLLYTSPSPRDRTRSRMPSSA